MMQIIIQLTIHFIITPLVQEKISVIQISHAKIIF